MIDPLKVHLFRHQPSPPHMSLRFYLLSRRETLTLSRRPHQRHRHTTLTLTLGHAKPHHKKMEFWYLNSQVLLFYFPICLNCDFFFPAYQIRMVTLIRLLMLILVFRVLLYSQIVDFILNKSRIPTPCTDQEHILMR